MTNQEPEAHNKMVVGSATQFMDRATGHRSAR
jgi:hypothetical protein